MFTSKAISTASVKARIGINTHLDFNNPAYKNLDITAAAINYLEIKNLRDSPGASVDTSTTGPWATIAHRTGAKFDAYMPEGSQNADIAALARVETLNSLGILNFIEGGDENDDPYPTSLGNSLEWTAKFQEQVFTLGQKLGLPVINMSFGSGWTAANNWHGNYDKVGNLSAFCDYANAHVYPEPGQLPDNTIQRLNGDALLAASYRPVIITEIGWDTGIFSEEIVASFVLDAVFDSVKNNNPKMYYYALFDDSTNKFGLMHLDGTPKPAGHALHNLMTILSDVGTPRTDSLSLSITGGVHDYSMLMQRPNGRFLLAIWNEIDPVHQVTINLLNMASMVHIYDPLIGKDPIKNLPNQSIVTLTISQSPRLIELTF